MKSVIDLVVFVDGLCCPCNWFGVFQRDVSSSARYVWVTPSFVRLLPRSLMSDRASQEIMAPPPSSMAPWPTSQLSKWPLSKTTWETRPSKVSISPKHNGLPSELDLCESVTKTPRAQKSQHTKTKNMTRFGTQWKRQLRLQEYYWLRFQSPDLLRNQ